MRVAVVIPARYASTRFPGKPLAKLAGKPMIQWVWEGVCESNLASAAFVATDDERIAEVVRNFGGDAVMTKAEHASGTDRVAEVASLYEADVYVNVQGDEPLIRGDLVDAIVRPFFEDPTLQMSTACREFVEGENPSRPDFVKVVTDLKGMALYFSRSILPFHRDSDEPLPVPYRLHLGLYAYRREFLKELAALAPTPLEQAEKLEQLRALEHGHRIRVVPVQYESIGVDRPEDLERAEFALRQRKPLPEGLSG